MSILLIMKYIQEFNILVKREKSEFPFNKFLFPSSPFDSKFRIARIY